MTFVFSQLVGYLQLIRNRWPPRKQTSFQLHRWKTRTEPYVYRTRTEPEPKCLKVLRTRTEPDPYHQRTRTEHESEIVGSFPSLVKKIGSWTIYSEKWTRESAYTFDDVWAFPIWRSHWSSLGGRGSRPLKTSVHLCRLQVAVQNEQSLLC